MSSDPYPIVVDWPQATVPFDTRDVGIQAQGQIGYLSTITLKLQSACGNSIFRMAWHEEFPTDGAGNVAPFHSCNASQGWTDPIPKANWAAGLTDADGFMKGDPPTTDFDGIAYACGGGVPCNPLAAIPGTVGGGQLNMTANAWSYQFIFVGSRDTQTLGKYWTTAPNKQVRYTDHVRDELGTRSCPGQ
jgi:hypothetical protein